MPRERVVNLGNHISISQSGDTAGSDSLWHFTATGNETELNLYNEKTTYFNKVWLFVNERRWRVKNSDTEAAGTWQFEVLTDSDGNHYGVRLNTAGGWFFSPGEPIDVWYE